MEVAGLIVAIIALLWGAFTFLFYDNKIKKQEERINKYQLKRFEEEDSENKKAQVRANIIKTKPGSRTLKIYNRGKSIARNIRMEFLSNSSFIALRDDDIFPLELLNTQDYIDIYMCLLAGGTSTIKIRLIWDDEYQKDNQTEQVLTL